MRHDAPFLVKRYAPPIGRDDKPKRIALAAQAYTLADALDYARSSFGQRFGPVWIERRGVSAVRPR